MRQDNELLSIAELFSRYLDNRIQSGEPPEQDFSSMQPRVPLGVAFEQPPSNGLSGLMAVNLIRAHRAELQQATHGKLDHLIIEVVSSLFDQILSDARVPPAMARQLARLQLPVLRAALSDGSFFSSRRHPVRRFINRVASLACAFESFESDAASKNEPLLVSAIAFMVTGSLGTGTVSPSIVTTPVAVP